MKRCSHLNLKQQTLNNFFPNIVKTLNIPKFNLNNLVTKNTKDPVFKAILKCKNHPSIFAIQKYNKNKTFHFEEMNIGKIRKLDRTKASQKTDIRTRIIKKNMDIFADFLCTSINIAIKSSGFRCSLKLADVTPVHKKGRKDMKKNFRPVSILPTLSKNFEKCMFAQMSTFFDNIFSNQQFGFPKEYSTQQGLLVMLEKLKRSVDKGKVFGALLTDL